MREEMEEAAAKLGIGGYRRHVLLCTGPKCCTAEEGAAVWEALKAAHKEAGLSAGENACYRTKVGCLRICKGGPVAVVYPEGTWYEGITPERVPELVRRHLAGGEPVEEWVFARNPIGG